ncbi:MAG: cytidylate kinase family protein [Hyphomicrobiaceae bacterium]|nr:cytidylate kinase family protein [Hyphomicrobiaceae bacterium]
MPVIAMTREMGTLGRDVAAGLAEKLGLRVVHHELVEQEIVGRSGLRESEVHRFLEGEASLLAQWRMDRKRLSHFTAQEILELAAKGDVLIRGWGATYLLRDVPNVVCVRICAPMDFRVQVMMRRLDTADPAAARREIERSDAAHNGTMQRLFGVDWRDATLYALTLNTDRIGPAACVDQIVRLVESEDFRATPATRAILMDRLVKTRVESALRDRFEAGLHAIGISVEVKEGIVTLMGAVSDERVITDIVRRASAVEGVVRVSSQIRYLSFARDGF